MVSALPNRPLVSIIMPFYRHDEYLLEAVESVRNQTYQNWQLIIVDDGSDRRSASEILGELASASSSKITVIRHEKNQGVPQAKNTALEHSHGEVIFPFDSDDVVLPEYLEKTVNFLMESGADGVYADFDLFGVQNRIVCTETNPVRIASGWFPPNPVVMRKEVLKCVGGYDPEFDLGEDACLWLGAYQKGKRFAHLHEPLYRYRRHSTSGTLMRGHDYPIIMKKLAQKYAQFYADNVVEIVDLLADHWIEDIHRHKDLLKAFHKKDEEYKHLHAEFHKLLSTVEKQSEENVRNSSIRQTLKLLVDQIRNRLQSHKTSEVS